MPRGQRRVEGTMGATHVHVDNLPISPLPTYRCSDNDQCILGDEISYASFILGTVARVCDKVELKGM